MTARLCAALLLLALGPATAAAAGAEVAVLLERSLFWQARQRDDLAREEVEKAIRLAPNDPDALLALGRLQLRANQEREAAATLQRMQSAQPNHRATAQLASLLRLRGPDRDRLRQARQLRSAGRRDEALKAWQALFADGYPDDELALEGAQVLGATRDGWEPARAQIAEIARRHPDDPRFQVALSIHMASRKPAAPETLRKLREMSEVPAVSRQAREAWRRAVLAMDPVEESLPPLRDYIAANPGDTAVVERLEESTRAVGRDRRVRNDPGLRAKREGIAALEARRLDEAATLLEQSLAIHPEEGEAVGALGLTRMRQGRHAEAVAQFERAAKLDAAGRGKWEKLAATSRYWALLREAREARNAGRLDEAEARATAARALDPNEGSATAELARVLVAAGRDREAEGLATSLDPEARRSIEDAVRDMRATRLRGEARKLEAAGRNGEAIAALEAAMPLDPLDPWLRHDLARLYAGRGDAARGRAIFEELLARKPTDADTRYAMALFLSSAGSEPEALAVLQAIAPGERSVNMTRLQRRLWVSVQGERALSFAQRGREAEGAAVLAAMQAVAGDDPELDMDIARSLNRLGKDAELREQLARMSAAPGAGGERQESLARLKLSLALRETRAMRTAGQADEAITLYNAMLSANPAQREVRLALVDTLLDEGRNTEARPHVAAALAQTPDDARALGQAGRLALGEGRLDEAAVHEQRAMALEPREDEGWRYRRLATMLDAGAGWYLGGLDSLYRSGSKGKSRLLAAELPLAWRQGRKPEGQWFFRATPAYVASGALDVNDPGEASTFGSLLLCPPPCAAPGPSASEQGLALAAGFERGALRADLGSSPLGFPVVNWVGGLAWRGDLGPMSYTVDASRRPLASSQLSYAGMRDPNTGQVWGGVVASGVRINVARDSGGEYGAWGLAGLYRLTGRNVQDNDKGEVMAGFYRRFVNEGDRTLAAGLTGMSWRFKENAGEYTFGHGGYYSPKWYRSLGLPVTFAARTALTSYLVRAAVSVAWSESRRAPYFPTDASLQSAAEALGGDPFYAGGRNGRSFGAALAGAVEHQVARGLFIGARVDLEHSSNYTPSRVLLYARFTPGRAAASPVGLPPESGLPGWPY